LKEEFLKLLDEDREFRYSVMARLGFTQLLERFAKLEERFADLEERFTKLEERFAGIEEKFAKLEERQLRLEEESRETRRLLTVISHRFGILTEIGFFEAMKYVVHEVLGAAKVEKWVFKDEDGFVYGTPSIIEVDIAVRDEKHVLVEVKSRASASDIAELVRIGTLYEKIKGVKPQLLILTGFVDAKAKELADKLNIQLKPIIKET
jgi:hypothetical protein